MDPKHLIKALDISDVVDFNAPMVEMAESLPAIPEDTPEENQDAVQAEVDFDYIRSNQMQIIEAGKEALNGALELAKSSENARSYEVVGTLMKSLADINKQLLELHEVKKDLKKDAAPSNQGPSQINNTQNNIIVGGSTAEILNRLKGMDLNIDVED